MKFSERMGLSNPRTLIQIDSIDSALKNGLWNVLISKCWPDLRMSTYKTSNKELYQLLILVWRDHFKLTTDTLPFDLYDAVKQIKNFFFNAKWYELYDFIEFIYKGLKEVHTYVDYNKPMQFLMHCNHVLQQEMSGFRFVEDVITPITSDIEIDEIEKSIQQKGKYSGSSTHLQQALHLLSDRKNPDFRNSIKESISAVESVCKVITNNPKASLGDALKKLESNNIKLHPSLQESFNKLYGYTSDEKGIRHSLLSDDNSINFDDAKYMLVTCSAFCNYLITKIAL